MQKIFGRCAKRSRCAKRRRAAWGTDGGITAQRGDALGHFTGGEDDHTLDRDSVGRSAGALGRSGAHMSDVGAVFLIFVIVAVALTAIKRRR